MYLTKSTEWATASHPLNDNEDKSFLNAVSFLIVRRGTSFLVQDHVKYDMLTIPCGKVEPDETVLHGLRREVREELGCELTFHVMLARSVRVSDNPSDPIVMDHLFAIEVDGEPINMEPEKHRTQEFMTMQELPKARKYSRCLVTAMEFIIHSDNNLYDTANSITAQYAWPRRAPKFQPGMAHRVHSGHSHSLSGRAEAEAFQVSQNKIKARKK